jgi:crotonobetaine/carnitine-CoA ligase
MTSLNIVSSKILPVIVRERAETTPDNVYLQDFEGAYSYKSVHEHGCRWSRAFRSLGVGNGDRVLVMLPVGVQAVYAWLGLGWCGAVETPLNYEYKGRMLDYVIRDSGASLLIVHAQYLSQVATATEGLKLLSSIVVIGTPDEAMLDAPARILPLDTFLSGGDMTAMPEEVLHESDLCTIMYTSGTTGPSKGVMVPWAQVEATSRWTIPIEDLGPSDAYYSPYPLFHIAGKLSIYTMAMVGGRAVLRERFSTEKFWDEVRQYNCTVVILLGAVANFLYRQPEQANDRSNPLSKVLMVPLIPEVEKFKSRFNLNVCTCWNMTETSSPIISPGWELPNASSCGRPREGIQCRLVDEHDNPVALGQEGELVVRANDPWTMMIGYLGKPDKTVEATRNQWLHTGDVFKQDEAGNLYFVDRKKDMIRRRGENISSVEVEIEVSTFPGVLECAAVGVPSEWGEEDVMVCVVTKPNHKVDTAHLHTYLRDRLPRFMVPRYIRLIDSMPKTPTQKIRKTELRDAGVGSDTSVFDSR